MNQICGILHSFFKSKEETRKESVTSKTSHFFNTESSSASDSEYGSAPPAPNCFSTKSNMYLESEENAFPLGKKVFVKQNWSCFCITNPKIRSKNKEESNVKCVSKDGKK